MLYLTCKQIPYRPKYRRVFSDAFDVFLEIIRIVDDRVKVALGQDSPDWRVLNACPACSYEVRSAQILILYSAAKCLHSLRMNPSSSSEGCMPSTAMTH